MNSFRYERPKNLVEALGLIAGLKEKSAPFILSSGGTDVIPMLKQHDMLLNQRQHAVLLNQRQHDPERPAMTFVSLGSIEELSGISRIDSVLRIGARTTLAGLTSDALIGKLLPGLALTAASVASPQIRNRATVGGNLLVNHRCVYFNQSEQNRLTHSACFKADGESCHLIPNARRDKLPVCRARFVSDLAAVLLVLDARIQLNSRTIALRDFYVPDGIERNQLRAGEILISVEIDLPGPRKLHYEKLRVRNAIDFPSLGVALGIDSSEEKGLELRIALVGLNARPVLLEFSGKDYPAGRQELLDAACTEATKAATPLRQDFFPPSYRKKMISVLIRRSFKKNAGFNF